MLFFERINPFDIIAKHFDTFYNNATGKKSITEIVILIIIIVLAGGATWWAEQSFTPIVSSSLLSFYAIVGGFLISSLFIVVSYGSTLVENRNSLPSSEITNARKLQKEIFSNVSFGVLISFLGSILSVFLTLGICERFISAVVVSTFVLFIHTLLMVLKRLNMLFNKTV